MIDERDRDDRVPRMDRVDLVGSSIVGAAGDRLEVSNLSASRGGRRVLDAVGFSLQRGALLAVVGPSGAGKSTLLSLLAGFERPDTGTIRFAGSDLIPLPVHARKVGMSFDDAALHEHLSAFENLEAAALPRREPAARRRARIESLARVLGIHELLSRKPATFSAGERRRVSIGRAFIRSPELVLLDEPFANLDRANRFAVRQMVRELQRSAGATTVVVTHDPTDALAIADDLLVLIDGRVRACGPARVVAAAPSDLEVAQLVDDLGMQAIELAADCTAPECELAPEFAERVAARVAASGRAGTIHLAMRPWHLRHGAPTEPSIALSARVVAQEPAGVFTDIIAIRREGRALRARVDVEEAQELPIGAIARLHAHERDLHVFVGAWPGTRVE